MSYFKGFYFINSTKMLKIVLKCFAACSSVFTTSLFGLAGVFPHRYMQASMSGQVIFRILRKLIYYNILQNILTKHDNTIYKISEN